MCGRYVMARSTGDLVAAFDVDETLDRDLEPSYNVAPTDEVPLVMERRASDDGGAPSRELVTARWGLVPSWSKDAKSGARLINARMETITEKPSFRQAASKRRALVAADGYFEWQQGCFRINEDNRGGVLRDRTIFS